METVIIDVIGRGPRFFSMHEQYPYKIGARVADVESRIREIYRLRGGGLIEIKDGKRAGMDVNDTLKRGYSYEFSQFDEGILLNYSCLPCLQSIYRILLQEDSLYSWLQRSYSLPGWSYRDTPSTRTEKNSMKVGRAGDGSPSYILSSNLSGQYFSASSHTYQRHNLCVQHNN